MATINIFPDADASPNDWSKSSIDFDTNYEHVDTQDAYYIYKGADAKYDMFGTDYNNQLEGSPITSVTIYCRAKKQVSTDNNFI